MTQWIDQHNQGPPFWVIKRGVEYCGYEQPMKFSPANWDHRPVEFKALCRHIYEHEKPHVDPDFERMRGVASLILFNVDCPGTALQIEGGEMDGVVQIALDKWRGSS